MIVYKRKRRRRRTWRRTCGVKTEENFLIEIPYVRIAGCSLLGELGEVRINYIIPIIVNNSK